MYQPLLLGGLAYRRQYEAQCKTVNGALAVIEELIALDADSPDGNVEQEATSPLEHVGWITVPDLGEVLETLVEREHIRSDADKRRQFPRRIEELRPVLPDPARNYTADEFGPSFEALLECIQLYAEIGEFTEAAELVNLGLDFVWQDGSDVNPFLANAAGELWWTVANSFADEERFREALDCFMAAAAGMRQAGIPSEPRRDQALTIVDRCLTLVGTRHPERQELLDLAGDGLALIDLVHQHEPGVVEARFKVARRRLDRRALRALLAESPLRLEHARIAGLLIRLDSPAEWRAVFGPFAAPVYAHCHELLQADGFAAFSENDEDTPHVQLSVSSGYRCIGVGHATLAEPGCDEIGAAISSWVRRAVRAGEKFVIDGQVRAVCRYVPTAAMHSLAAIARRPTDEIPQALSFLFDLGRQAVREDTARVHSHIDAMVRFFEDAKESDAAFTCAAILVGAVLELLPGGLVAYIGHLEVAQDHAEAFERARRGIPIHPVARDDA